MKHGLTIFFIDCSGERDIHGTGFHTVLRVAAVSNAVVTHDPLQSLIAIHDAAGMHVEEPDLRDCLRADVVILVILRTRFETATASHATRICITFHHFVLVHPRSGSEIVSTVQLNPRMNALQVIEHLGPIYL